MSRRGLRLTAYLGILDRWMGNAHWRRCELSVMPLVARIQVHYA